MLTTPSSLLSALAVCVVLLSGGAFAQQVVVRQAPQTVLDGLRVRRATLQELSVPQIQVEGFEVVVQLAGKDYQLVLREHDIRAADFKLIAAGKDGLRVLPTPRSSTYRGVVAGQGESRVAASLIDGQLTAFIQFAADQTAWSVQPVTRVLPNAGRALHVVHSGRAIRPSNHRCGVQQHATAPIGSGGPVITGQGPIHETELALDLDFDEYKNHGKDLIATQYDATSIINACNLIYRRDVEVEFLLTTIIVRTTQVYTRSGYSALLSDYRSRWRSQHSGVRRDISHLLTGKYAASGVIGVAYLGTICNSRYGYGLSFTHFSQDFQQRVGLTAHEIGHSYGSDHCDSTGDCYIMCSVIGSCSGSLTQFGSKSRAAIISHRNSRSCLRKKVGNEPRLDSVSPTRVQVFRGGTITLTGKNFTGATSVTVGSTVLTPGSNPRISFQVLSDTSISFAAPTGESYAPHSVYVSSPTGVSSRLFLSYSVTLPRRLDVEPALSRGDTAHWEFGAGARHDWILTISASPTTYALLGHTWLQTPIVLLSGSLNHVGYGEVSATVPSSTPLGLRFYSQVVTINPFMSKLAGNTNVSTSRIK